ncbi:MAG TPA: capsule assembly Wzi family protein [Steroidobacteraceae bacterium]|nr:capsule assembly Wzi family protein [Steroidobacteraceae bacterium]
MQIRHDIEFLVDSGVIDLPVTYWPIATSDLANALADLSRAGMGEEGSLSSAQQVAIARLRHIASEGHRTLGVEVAAAARPTTLRTFEDTPREEGELTGYAAGFFGDRYGGRLEVTAVVDPDDDKTVRLDGSYVAGMFGNWIVTAGAQERWWGSGWEGSLILSTNARPVPALALDRAVSLPFESKWLRWIGPWRLTTFMGRMEGDREDYDHPLLWGMRISARPFDGLELSVDRAAQWCGEGRSCDASDFWNLFTGHDNRGENVAAEDEPGNQLASYEIRWSSPIGDAPYALYFQHTGESIDNNIPRPYRTLDLAGLELWGHGSSSGSSWRTVFEYARTRCGGTQDGQRLWDCAYNNSIFHPDGYRYYGRPVGHAMDGDGEMYSARLVHVDASARTLSAVARFTKINDGGAEPDTRHSIAPGPEEWISLDLGYRRTFGRDSVEAGFGVDHRDQEWAKDEDVLPRTWVRWSRQFR